LGAGMIVSSIIGKSSGKEKTIREYTKAEKELNEFIRTNYPEWDCKEI
jgi:sulfate adenylyltransferase subunit 1